MGERGFKIEKLLEAANHVDGQFFGSIDAVHELIHEGCHFTFNSIATKNSGEDFNLTMLVPANLSKETHLSVIVSSSSSGSLGLYESSAVTGGSSGTAYNNNRLSSKVAGASLLTNPIVSATGPSLEVFQVGTQELRVKELVVVEAHAMNGY